MVLRTIILAISLFSVNALASGELGFAPSFRNDNKAYSKTYLNVYENAFDKYYINPYVEKSVGSQIEEFYARLDFNRHFNRFNVGFGLGAGSYGEYKYNEVRCNVVLKLW